MHAQRSFGIVALALVAGGCRDTGPTDPSVRGEGLTAVYLTDAPFPYDAIQSVDVYVERISVSTGTDTAGDGTAPWISMAQPMRRFDLLALQGSGTAFLGEKDLPAGQYRAVRMVINTDSSSVTSRDGSRVDVEWQVPGSLALNALVEAPIDVPDDGARIVIDFDVGRSFLPRNDGLLFIPWIRAVNEAATGTLAGRVRWERGPAWEPVADGAVVVLRGDSLLGPNGWSVAATGLTDSAGGYTIPYLLAGTYIVQASPPPSLSLGTATVTGVEIAVGATTTVDLILPPGRTGAGIRIVGDAVTTVGDSAFLTAIVYDANGDSVPNPSVDWESLDPAVAVVAGFGSVVPVAGLSPGTASVVARSGALADTATVTVVADTTVAVGSVEVSPAVATVAAGDSVRLTAIVRDADGNLLGGRYVLWWSADSSVVEVGSLPGFGDAGTAWIRAISPGVATVNAVSEGKQGSASVTVSP